MLNNDYELERDLTMVVIDPKLREYTSLENMRKLFFEETKSYRVVIAEVLQLLGWTNHMLVRSTGIKEDRHSCNA
ncbi:hypothetical protein AGMMS49992_27150 [Clostridia bacterium]|nr:hypothetical protein AGMMS49992_27150 [Clostridia bacterium]